MAEESQELIMDRVREEGKKATRNSKRAMFLSTGDQFFITQ